MSDRIALLGGTPIRPGGPPRWPFPDVDVLQAIAAAATAGAWGEYHGEQIPALEAELAAYHNVSYALTCASGTLAVEAALRALRVAPGDEVIMSAYDYESNFLNVHAIGAKPVLIDVSAQTGNMDVAHLEAAITPQTRAVICSHLHGGIVPMPEVMAIAKRRGVGVVEDAAQAAGAIVNGKPAGSWGDVGTLSFGGSKLLCAGRGGALLIRDSQLLQRAKLWLSRGLQQWAALSELQAAALRPQLRKLVAATAHRAKNVQAIRQSLEAQNLDHLVTPFVTAETASSAAFYKVGFHYDSQAFGVPRDLFVAALRAEGIAFDIGFKSLHIGRSPSRFRAVGALPQATAQHQNCVILHHPVLAESSVEVEQVTQAIARVHFSRDALRQANAISEPLH